ncbi:hypothetical protein M758_4G138900 [Ceratodon purpureus]|nr:hypothetical protein M758_4G138900 [Ceratodon purpureus]
MAGSTAYKFIKMQEIISTIPDEVRILFLSLDNAGKTTTLRAFLDGEIRFLLYDPMPCLPSTGGQRTIRPCWRNPFEATDALVYVIDCADRHRLEESGDELSLLLEEMKMVTIPLLVLANKQDDLQPALPADEGGMNWLLQRI